MTMTDTMDAESAALLEQELSPGTPGKPCKLPGCPNTLEPDAPNRSEFCLEHRGRSPEKRKLRRDWMKEHGDAGQDKAPNVVVQLGGSKTKAKSGGKGGATADQIAAVEQRALWLAQTGAAFMLIATKGPHREADAGDIAAGAPGWAAAVGELAKHEEWLRNLGAGGEMSERAVAWVGLGVATTTMALPILLRHEVIKGGLAELFATMVGNVQHLGADNTAAA